MNSIIITCSRASSQVLLNLLIQGQYYQTAVVRTSHI